ncbi:hypothetical protein SAMN02745117_00866 [Lampropedia hyalina DSM 16112]|jgi:hypothetical protein|uniref:Uncharacterized protein n=1 Tax=Lampropedia hyalina DSM 16112 TaxID=1122156 RepID=A0A1M4WHY2_9BURK|nr:hypothetical protein [Lampropedia hyalina]SHE80838.1 hypothetical protein SAMN02745117_00866 [Lampropedia hyalina DSM 16112]
MNPNSPSTHAPQQEQQALMELLSHSILRYAERDGTQPLTDWLAHSLEQEGQLAPQAAHSLASDFVAHIGRSHQLRSELQQHQQQKKSRASWLAEKIEEIAVKTGASPVEVAAATTLFSDQALQANANQASQPAKLEWNRITRLQVAQELEQSQQHQAAQSLLQQVQTLVHDPELLQQSPKASQLVDDYLQGKLPLNETTGLQATLATATDIAARKGLLGEEFQKERETGKIGPEWFSRHSFTGTENVRIIHAAGTGKLNPTTAMNVITDTATSAAIGAAEIFCGRLGGSVGAVIAGFFTGGNPVGIMAGQIIGKAIGSTLARIAQTPVRKAIQKGMEAIKNVAGNVVRKTVGAVKSVGKSIASFFGF